MKILVILLLFPLSSFGQKNTIPSTFFIDDQKILVWQKIYETDLSGTELQSSLSKHFNMIEFTRGLDYEGNKFYGYSGELKVKPIKGGPLYNPVTAFINVDVKENRYRVTIKDIKYNSINAGVNVGMISMSETKTYGLEEYVLKSGKREFKKGFVKVNILKSYDMAFDNIFVLRKINALDDDW